MGNTHEASTVLRRIQRLPSTETTSAASRRRQPAWREFPLRLPPFPAEGLSYAMAFDGELYTKADFLCYYGVDRGDEVWQASQVRTHRAACFVHIWFDWTRRTGQGALMVAVGTFLRSTEWLTHDYWRVRVIQFVFRALALRDEFLALHPQCWLQEDLNNPSGRKELNRIAMEWTKTYIIARECNPCTGTSSTSCVLAELVRSQRLCYDCGHTRCRVLARTIASLSLELQGDEKECDAGGFAVAPQ